MYQYIYKILTFKKRGGRFIPLFGPNIKKMKQKGDIDGLINFLKSKNPQIRVEATEALKDFDDWKAIESLNTALLGHLKFGEGEEQVEAITIIQGRAPENFLKFALPGEEKRVQVLKKVQKKLSIETFRDALLEIVQRRKSATSVWYSLVALVELGDRSNEVLNNLIEFSDAWIKKLTTEWKGTSALFAWAIARSVIEETLRSLSYFKSNSVATDALVRAYEGEFLSGRNISEDYLKQKAICALVVLGDPSVRERLEYLASHARFKVPLELYGKATYDEIKGKVRTD